MSDPAYTCHFLEDAARSAAEDQRIALARVRDTDEAWKRANNATYGWARFAEVVRPCAMWYARWYFDPENPEHKIRREKALDAIVTGTFGTGERNYYLSRFYWEDWSHIRPPICVLCPNGDEWCVDAKSSNGEGWKVTGSVPTITAQPSIATKGYHGFLNNGVFTGDLDAATRK